jgi:hypothetical protein
MLYFLSFPKDFFNYTIKIHPDGCDWSTFGDNIKIQQDGFDWSSDLALLFESLFKRLGFVSQSLLVSR